MIVHFLDPPSKAKAAVQSPLAQFLESTTHGSLFSGIKSCATYCKMMTKPAANTKFPKTMKGSTFSPRAIYELCKRQISCSSHSIQHELT